MALSLVLPAIVFMGLLAKSEYDNGRRRYELQLLAMTRALALATDRQIAQGQATLQALAVSPALQARDFSAFDAQARGALKDKPGWIVLFSKEAQVVNTVLPPGAPMPPGTLSSRAWREFQSGRRVSNLTFGPVSKGPVFVLDMPVVIEGEVYDLAYIQNPNALRSIFMGQGLPQTWSGTIIDRSGRLVARSRGEGPNIGREISLASREAMARSPEGILYNQNIEGVKTLSAYSRSPSSGWFFMVGVPRRELQSQVLNSVVLIALATGVLLSVGVLGALLVGRRISRDMRSLVMDAQAIARGDAVAPRPKDLEETSEVRRALRHVSSELLERERERSEASARQQVMINELNHRVKNTLATVQSLARQSLGRNDPDGRRAAFIDRLLALSRAHDLLTRRVWENAELGEVVALTLEPYRDRANVHGPTIWLSANSAVALSMVFHEMATNASKYGALSAAGGRVEVLWRAEGTNLVLTWTEHGGPPATPPTTQGFGSRLIATALKSELGGEVTQEHLAEGLRFTARLPFSARVSPFQRASLPLEVEIEPRDEARPLQTTLG